jgi:hypothetical protein
MIRAFLQLAVLSSCCLATTMGSAAPNSSSETEAAAANSTEELVGQPHYDNWAMLLGQLGSEAASSFSGFFDSTPLRVHPFVHLGAGNELSLLGVLLADQMVAMLNGQVNAYYSSAENGESQILEGVLQEVDGYLRIHMLGMNRLSQRRSHLAMVEMSPGLYRALHAPIDFRQKEQRH